MLSLSSQPASLAAFCPFVLLWDGFEKQSTGQDLHWLPVGAVPSAVGGLAGKACLSLGHRGHHIWPAWWGFPQSTGRKADSVSAVVFPKTCCIPKCSFYYGPNISFLKENRN